MNKQKLKICHITSMHDPGDDRIYQRACVGLARQGHDVSLVALAENGTGPDVLSQRGVNIHLLQSRAGWKRRWFGSRDAINKAIEIDAEVYTIHDPDLLPHAGKLVRKRPESVVLYDIHENYASRFESWGLPRFLGTVFRRYENRVIRKLHGITVVSKSMKSMFENVGVPIAITRNSIDTHRLQGIEFSQNVQEQPAIVITSGSHSHARCCLQTVKAMGEITELTETQPTFQFVGKYLGGIDEEMLRQSESDNTSARLVLDGMVPWEENFSRVSAATCGCVFYADNPNNRVGIPNRLFEYMYCGLPVIVSDFEELSAIVNDAQCGIVVDSEDPQDIARGISEVLNDPERAQQMGGNGRKAIHDQYGYHVDLDRLEKFYYSLLNAAE